jgi:hypothetical protein
MRNIIFYIISICSIGLFSFSPQADSIAEYKRLVSGVWKIESLKIRKAFTCQKVDSFNNDFHIRFDPSGKAVILDANTGSAISFGSWRITCSETLVASDPFVYREDLILNLDFAIPQLSIESGDDIFLELKRSKLNVRYLINKLEYQAKLIPAQ